MLNNHETRTQKPSAVSLAQILIYLAAVLNIVNGIYSFGSTGIIKKLLCIGMIVFGAAAFWVAARLGHPHRSRLTAAIALSIILIILRLLEFSVWHNIGFLLGVILPILVIWRLNSAEAKSWFR
ncbi:hypothetical protein G8C92_21970 [Paenibacillus donghaensis]|uniref:hypothetical protein n=1 Tax=Paenibacillus donghaensis TaxID=414771 RepID=UPI001883E5FE|nr:hypothetical protein [Paenibacillus donghaensis]MBE9916688.1 hypothetical protein [Paenibacillus donghaensis]